MAASPHTDTGQQEHQGYMAVSPHTDMGQQEHQGYTVVSPHIDTGWLEHQGYIKMLICMYALHNYAGTVFSHDW